MTTTISAVDVVVFVVVFAPANRVGALKAAAVDTRCGETILLATQGTNRDNHYRVFAAYIYLTS